MRELVLLVVVFVCANGISQTVINNVGKAAKSKLESQDFNSSRTNKDKANLRNENRNAPAPAAVPSPSSKESAAPDTTPVPVPAIPADNNTVKNGNRTYLKVYTFDNTMTYEMSDPSKPGKAAELVTYNYSNRAVMTQMSQNANMIVLTDFPHEVAITFDEKNKSAMVMSTKWATNLAQNFSSDETTVTKTGQTKEILGKKCEEYIITSKKSSTSCFITTEVKMNYAKTVEALTKNNVSSGNKDFPAECLMMEMTSYNKKGEAESHMIIKSFSEEKSVKSVESYKVTVL